MGEEYSISEVANRVGDLRVEVGKLQTLQETNHRQNRNDIAELKTGMTAVNAAVNKIGRRVSWASGAAGVITAAGLKGIDLLAQYIHGAAH